MQYINPIEILQLSNIGSSTLIDIDTIKKAKRRLIAEIDLSDDGTYNYYGVKLSKGDCEKAIDELSNKDHKEFYLYLSSNKKLNEFLVNGNEKVFTNFTIDSIFKLPEFIFFISPYYAPKFDKALSNAFEVEDAALLKSIIKTSFLISQNNINIAYKSLSHLLQNRLSEISEIRTDIKNEVSIYDDDNIQDIIDIVKDYFPSELLNSLPSYFQSQILKIANEINYLTVAIWDNFDNAQISQDLLEHILTLNIDGLNKPTFEKNYEIIKRKNQERIEEQRNAPLLIKYASFLIQTKTKIEEVENKTISPNLLLYWVNSSISIHEVESLPQTFDEIKNQVALSLRAMSISVWNSYSNIEVSIDLINKANNITGIKSETKNILIEAKKQLTDLKTKIEITNQIKRKNDSTKTISHSSSSSKNNSGCLLLTIGGLFILLIILLSDSNNSSFLNNNQKSNKNTKNTSTTSNINSNENRKISPTKTPSPNKIPKKFEETKFSKKEESEYKGNQLRNGASPLDDCFGQGSYSGNAVLTVDNDGSSDAILCLYNVDKRRTIRNEYIRKNSRFTINNIPQGSYKIRVFYGNDWNPNLTNNCGTKGNFESDVEFSEFDEIQYFEDSERGYTTATMTLYTVSGGNATTSSIDQSTFFNN